MIMFHLSVRHSQRSTAIVSNKIGQFMLNMVIHGCPLSIGRLRQEDQKFEASLGAWKLFQKDKTRTGKTVHAPKPEDPWNPYSGKKEPNPPKLFLTSTHEFCVVCVFCVYVHVHTLFSRRILASSSDSLSPPRTAVPETPTSSPGFQGHLVHMYSHTPMNKK